MNNNHVTQTSSLLIEFQKEMKNADFRFKAARGGLFRGSRLSLEFIPTCGGDIAYSPDGLLVAFGTGEGTIKIHDIQTGSLAHEFQAHTGNVRSVSFSPNGRLLVSGSDDHAVKIWDVKTGSLKLNCFGHQGYVISVRFLPDGCQVISQSRDGTVNIWDAETGELKHGYRDKEDVNALSLSPDCRHCVSIDRDHVFSIWDVKTGKLTHVCRGHKDSVTSVSFSPDGRRIASGSEDRIVKIWDVETGMLLQDCRGHNQYVTSVSFSPDGRHLVSGSWDKTLKMWDSLSGELLHDLHGHESGVNTVSFSPNGRRIASGGNDQTVKIWDAETGLLLYDCREHKNWVRSVRFAPNASHIISQDDFNRVLLWDVRTGQVLYDFTKRKYCENRLAAKLNLSKVPRSSEKTEVNIDTPDQACIADFEGTKICLATDCFDEKTKYELTFDRFGSATLITSVPTDSVCTVEIQSWEQQIVKPEIFSVSAGDHLMLTNQHAAWMKVRSIEDRPEKCKGIGKLTLQRSQDIWYNEPQSRSGDSEGGNVAPSKELSEELRIFRLCIGRAFDYFFYLDSMPTDGREDPNDYIDNAISLLKYADELAGKPPLLNDPEILQNLKSIHDNIAWLEKKRGSS